MFACRIVDPQLHPFGKIEASDAEIKAHGSRRLNTQTPQAPAGHGLPGTGVVEGKGDGDGSREAVRTRVPWILAASLGFGQQALGIDLRKNLERNLRPGFILLRETLGLLVHPGEPRYGKHQGEDCKEKRAAKGFLGEMLIGSSGCPAV